MAILIISDENLRVLKNILMTDFEIRSSHASEGIAALCGFRTNAAMKENIANFSRPPVAELDFEQFENRLQQIGYDDQFALDYLRTTYTNIAFPDRPWGTFKRKEQALRDDWFYECERKNIPFITINKKNKYCTIEWDCISIHPKDDGHVRKDEEGELLRRIFQIFQLTCKGVDTKSFFYGSAFVGDIKNLSESSARMLANTYFSLLSPWRISSHEMAS